MEKRIGKLSPQDFLCFEKGRKEKKQLACFWLPSKRPILFAITISFGAARGEGLTQIECAWNGFTPVASVMDESTSRARSPANW